MCKQTLGPVLSMLNIGNTAPVPGDIGVELVDNHEGAMRPSEYLITAIVTGAPSDLVMYGVVMHLSDVDTPADDQWGLHNNVYGTQVGGKIGSALPVGTHHFVVKDVGIYTRLFFVKSAGAIDVYVRPILYSGRGS
jgi:hypothetical protein